MSETLAKQLRDCDARIRNQRKEISILIDLLRQSGSIQSTSMTMLQERRAEIIKLRGEQ